MTDLVLDTHVALWWAEDPAQLSPDAQHSIIDRSADVWVSVAAAWELAIKVRAGKLSVDTHALFRGLTSEGIRVLGIGVDDAIEAGLLNWSHRDPFDRMLVAQARRRKLVVLTRDRALLDFDGIETLAA